MKQQLGLYPMTFHNQFAWAHKIYPTKQLMTLFQVHFKLFL